MDSWLYVVAGVLGVLVILVLQKACNGPLAHLPGPWYSKLTTWPLYIYWLLGKKALYVHQLHAKYGPVVRVAPDEADICDVSAKQIIYSTKEVYLKSEFYDKVTGGNSDSIFGTRDIDKHRHFRRLLSGPISDISLKVVEPLVRRWINLAIERMTESMQTKGFADVFYWAFLMTTDIIGELSFGESFGNLETGEEGEYLEDVHNVDWAASVSLVFPWLFKTKILAQESLLRYRQRVDEDPVNVKPTLFTKLLKAGEEETLTFEQIVQNARTYLVAGSDTTANTLTYLIWAVCKHPEIRDKLVAELTEKLPETNNFSDADVRQLPYLNCVIEEALRLHGSVPSGLPRTVPARGAELAGHWFPAGASVTSQAYSLHRDPSIHPNPDAFEPDRWSPGRVTKVMKDANIAFGGGARICIGMHLAKMELRLATALFFRTFPRARVSTKEGMSDRDMEHKAHFLLAPKGKRCHIEEEANGS